jgi:hypothetical protein
VDVSDDGRYITFPSRRTAQGTELDGIIVYDRLLQTATNLGGNPPQFSGGETVISGDGRFVVFDTYDQILPEDQNEYEDVYLVDRTALPPSGPVTVTFNASADTYVRSGSDNRNVGAGGFMNIQSTGNNRSLVRFDESALQSAIGNSEILSAKLRLTITDNGNNWGATGRTVAIYRLLTNWAEGNGTENDRGTGEGATWNCATDNVIQNLAKNCSGATEWEMGQPNAPQLHPWVQPATDSQTITNHQAGVVEYDVTSDVTSFIDGANNNFGWIIKKTEEGQNGQISFGTKESSSAPQLVVTYQP